MHADRMHLLELLDIRPDEGVIRLHDQRMVLQGAAALGLLRRELMATLGLDVSRRLLMRFGYADGYHDAVSLRDHFTWSDPLDSLRAGLRLQLLEGIVRAEPLHLALDPAAGTFHAELSWRNSYEAEQHLLRDGSSATPVCWTLAGYVSGYASACFGFDAYFREVECVACGNARCMLIGRHAAGWHEELPDVHADFRGVDLRGEVERLRQMVAAQRRSVDRRRGALARQERRRSVLQHVTASAGAYDFVARSQPMYDALDLAMRVAPLDTTVLVTGESGTGKEFFARFIHEQSPRARAPLVAVNCGALAESLLESELFGHARGAFTGATYDKVGLFEQANRGTLFLDEVGEMTPALQVKLLRALQEREIRRVGGDRTIKVDVRIVAATNRDLRTAVTEGRYREDLYFRLSGLDIHVPPLRQRREEIPVLVMTFLRAVGVRIGKTVTSVSPQAMGVLVNYSWPGNVRELEHTIERGVILARDGVLRVRDLPAAIRAGMSAAADGQLNLRVHEEALVREAMARFDGNRRRAAAALGISTVSLWRKLKALERGGRRRFTSER